MAHCQSRTTRRYPYYFTHASDLPECCDQPYPDHRCITSNVSLRGEEDMGNGLTLSPLRAYAELEIFWHGYDRTDTMIPIKKPVQAARLRQANIFLAHYDPARAPRVAPITRLRVMEIPVRMRKARMSRIRRDRAFGAETFQGARTPITFVGGTWSGL